MMQILLLSFWLMSNHNIYTPINTNLVTHDLFNYYLNFVVICDAQLFDRTMVHMTRQNGGYSNK